MTELAVWRTTALFRWFSVLMPEAHDLCSLVLHVWYIWQNLLHPALRDWMLPLPCGPGDMVSHCPHRSRAPSRSRTWHRMRQPDWLGGYFAFPACCWQGGSGWPLRWRSSLGAGMKCSNARFLAWEGIRRDGVIMSTWTILEFRALGRAATGQCRCGGADRNVRERRALAPPQQGPERTNRDPGVYTPWAENSPPEARASSSFRARGQALEVVVGHCRPLARTWF